MRSHPLAAVAAVARRRSSLRQIGLELFFVGPDLFQRGPGAAAAAAAAAAPAGGMAGFAAAPPASSSMGPVWDAPSAFFAFR